MEPKSRSFPEVFVIAGFLGAGKTTLLKNILESDQNLSGTAVIVNEFGEVGIDGTILRRGLLKIIELVNGCICCSLSVDLSATLDELIVHNGLQRIFIEATGLAEPNSIMAILRRESFSNRFSISGVICVLDARMWKTRKQMGPLFLNQLTDVETIILNKIDMVGNDTAEQIAEEVRSEIPGKNVISTTFCKVDINHLRKNSLLGPYKTNNDNDYSHLMSYYNFTFRESKPLVKECVERALKERSHVILRAKGFVLLEKKTMLLNFTGGDISWEEWREERETSLVVISNSNNFEEIRECLKNCVKSNG